MNVRRYIRIRELTKFGCHMSSGKEVYFRMNPCVQVALKSNSESKERLFSGRRRWDLWMGEGLKIFVLNVVRDPD